MCVEADVSPVRPRSIALDGFPIICFLAFPVASDSTATYQIREMLSI